MTVVELPHLMQDLCFRGDREVGSDCYPSGG